VALVDETGATLFLETLAQETLHERYGGVVPEVASRAHAQILPDLVSKAFKQTGTTFSDLFAIAVTRGPGLSGSLLVGVSFAKGLAFSHRIPIVPVHHVIAHLRGAFSQLSDLRGKTLGLVVSGGHTHLYDVTRWPKLKGIARTVDDAAGEIFDKGGKLMGLPFPGGPAIERMARANSRPTFPLTKGPIRTEDPMSFSFSGMKTAFSLKLRQALNGQRALPIEDQPLWADSLQTAILDHLFSRISKAVEAESPETFLLGGGVAINRVLRERMTALCQKKGINLLMAPPNLCGDNALSIALIGLDSMKQGLFTPFPYQGLSVQARWDPSEMIS
jgi:N6-L-threonylcarbamoyladenine synthase